ncbi:transposase [Candidatus Lariskella endosymbiont of Hedychridium roseum]|uniref:IS701 family transposase n=1 Tax=Candidatus Lariskella endosymbiont of Hedychridium roseum TaxID=3077949 RepID=UPI0030CD292A
MSKKILDIYSDYLICQNKYATATGLSDLLSGDISHDKITKYLNSEDLGSKELWLYIKPEIRKHELNKGCVLILDDSIEEKPYTDENEIVAWHHSYAKGRHVKGINILSCLVSYGDVVLPFGYALIRKDVSFSDIETGKVQRKSSISKNQHFRNLIKRSTENKVLFEHILADNWFGSKENMEFIESLGKKFIIGIKSNRIIALSCKDKKLGKFQQISSLDMQDGESKKVWLKGVSFEVLLIKKVFINEDGSTGILYLASNDTEHDAAYLYEIYQKRWRIEEYHKSIKENTSLAKSPTKKMRSQANHIFASIVAFCKLEIIKVATATNHFAIKYKLLVAANIASMNELINLRKNNALA